MGSLEMQFPTYVHWTQSHWVLVTDLKSMMWPRKTSAADGGCHIPKALLWDDKRALSPVRLHSLGWSPSPGYDPFLRHHSVYLYKTKGYNRVCGSRGRLSALPESTLYKSWIETTVSKKKKKESTWFTFASKIAQLFNNSKVKSSHTGWETFLYIITWRSLMRYSSKPLINWLAYHGQYV
jgi:hypothetical protein